MISQTYEFTKDKCSIVDFTRVNTKKLFWINVVDPAVNDLQHIMDLISCDIHTLERIIDEEENPYVQETGDITTITFKAPILDTDGTELVTSFAIILTKKGIITLHRRKIKAISQVQHNFIEKKHMPKSKDDILHAILHEVIHDYAKSIDVIETQIEELENRVIESKKDIIGDIFEARKTLTYFSKSLKANREIAHTLMSGHVSRVETNNTFIYLSQDISQVVEAVDTAKDVLHNLAELNSTVVANELSRSMKEMTVYATLVLIPTLIASIYGMNFVSMPELNWKYGYLFSLALMVVSVAFVWGLFKKKGWL